MKNRWMSVAVALLFLASGVAFGQAQTGNIFARAADDQGTGLPGVSVTLSGVGAPFSQVTNANGDVRFPNLAPASYALDFNLQGFGKVTRKNIIVAVGQNTQIEVTMKLAGVQESVVVAGESSLLDTRKSGSQTNVTRVELESVPTSRDPWAILQTAPGVQIDRVNVGGSESGQQAVYVGKGSGTAQGTWNVDGVNITDMGALGSSPAYYDYDSFAEMNISTGGADAASQTPGVQVNMVTKRGTNDVHGSARLYYESRKLSSTNVPDELIVQQQSIGNAGSGNSVDALQDAGVEVGGPILKDHLWLWGNYARTQVDLITAGGTSDKTTLQDFGFKLNAQVIPQNSFTGVLMNNDKQKFGRNAGPTHPPESTWNQSGPTKLYKAEDSHIFSADVFATASFSRVMGGFQLISVGRGQMYQDAAGVYHNSYIDFITQRPQTQVSVQPSFFLRTGNIGHEFKVGFNYRKTPVTSNTSWPTGILGVNADFFGSDTDVAGFTRASLLQSDLKSYSGYISDTMTVNKLTVNVGVRYDYQWGQNTPGNIPCCNYDLAAFPQVPFTALSIPGTAALTWKDFAPRLGLTYALGNENKTLLRASYARFTAQMGSGNVTPNGFSSGVSYLYYEWNDANKNLHVDQGEVNFNNLVAFRNIGADPNSLKAPLNQVDYNMKTPKTDEIMLGVEHELLPAFVVGAMGTFRHRSDLLYNTGTTSKSGDAILSADGSRVLTPADFDCTQVGPFPVPGGTPQFVTQCNPKAGVAGRGIIETNRPGYYQTYWGIDLSATKRYSNKWMARFNFTYSDWKQHGLAEGQVDPSNYYGGSEADGGAVASQSTGSGSKGFVWINSKWQGTLSAMYTLPLDFNLSTSVFARQGYAAPYFVRLASANLPGIATKDYALGAIDDIRMPTVLEWDLGLAKVIKVAALNVTLQADCFNLLNRNTALQRQLRVRSTLEKASALDNNVFEIQSPRLVRLGARISF